MNDLLIIITILLFVFAVIISLEKFVTALVNLYQHAQDFYLWCKRKKPGKTQSAVKHEVVKQPLFKWKKLSKMKDQTSVREAIDFDRADIERINAAISQQEGNDPRKQLEHLYSREKSPVDLHNLALHLRTVGDWKALQPLVYKLFERERTVKNALDVVECLGFSDYESILTFLEANPDIFEQSNDLKAAKAWALFQAGRLQESKQINDILLRHRKAPHDLQLDINVAICSGNWEHIAAIVDREWDQRDLHSPDTIMILAHLAAQQTQNPERALQLARLAAERAPEDPQILAAAYWLHFRLGRDDKAEPVWLKHAADLSSSEKGPLWSVSLSEFITELAPKRRDHMLEVEQKWLNGEIPASLAVGVLNVPLAHLLLYTPSRNADEPDGRCQMLLPVIAGGRNPVELQKDWTVGLDVTSIMILSYLNLLETAVSAFYHTKLSPDVMELLFLEKGEACFHQPSRIEAAKQIRELHDKKLLKTDEESAVPHQTVSNEVGLKLAALLQSAKNNHGKVVCVLPIHKPGLPAVEHADTKAFNDLICSTTDLCKLFYDAGKIDAESFQRAKLLLEKQGQTTFANLSPSTLNKPVYIDHLALPYLQDAKILKPLTSAGMNIRVHPDVLQEANALIGAEGTSDTLVENIESIRRILGDAIESKAASFLPRLSAQDQQHQHRKIQFQTTASLLAGSDACQTLCVDDRYINSHSAFTDASGQSISLVCVLDVLRYLLSQKHIDASKYWSARHRLRQGGFAFIPLEAEELIFWLKKAKVNKGQLTESQELRVIRQMMARISFRQLANSSEALPLARNIMATLREVLISLREDNSLTAGRVTGLIDWVWRHMAITIFSRSQDDKQGSSTDQLRKALVWQLINLFLPVPNSTPECHQGYTNWIERSVLRLLRPANVTIINEALKLVIDGMSELGNGRQLYGNLFLKQLPKAARIQAISQHTDLVDQFGVQANQILRIGPNIKLEERNLFAAVKEVFHTKKRKQIQDIDQRNVSINLDDNGKSISLGWNDEKGAPHKIPVFCLGLLSPDSKTRRTVLSELIDGLGPTAKDFRNLLKEISSRELTCQELSEVFNESINGVATIQNSLIQKINHASLNVADMVPQSIAYFERFAGPAPDGLEPESYFQKILIPYRKTLLDRDLNAGLDICCLGALRDDLTPGGWIQNADNDAVWSALTQRHAQDNPFSLLAALDIAMYRLADSRFQGLAEKAVTQLLNKDFEQRDGLDIHRLFQACFDFVANQINYLENGSNYPGYWKRMCAWMQAGLLTRAFIKSPASINFEDFQKSIHEGILSAGVYAGFVSARKEPMVFAELMTAIPLHNEILDRLYVLKLRHEKEGRQAPKSEDINRLFDQGEGQARSIVSGLPGPLEGHKQPTNQIPQEFSQQLEKAWAAGAMPPFLQLLALASQLFLSDKLPLKRAREAVNKLSGRSVQSGDKKEILIHLQSASIIAAACRDTTLADEIADVIISITPDISSGEEVETILLVLLLAASSNKEHSAWFKWLEERLTNVATHLPSRPNECMQAFLCELCEIEIILPVESWFHIRAKLIASACV